MMSLQEAAGMNEQIELMMKKLKLSGMAKRWREVDCEDNEQYIARLLEIELKERDVNRINRMVKNAGFRVIKTLDEFHIHLTDRGSCRNNQRIHDRSCVYKI